jgi:predicted RND superfamily exporter protein
MNSWISRYRWLDAALARPRLTVVAAVTLAASIGAGMHRLQLETDGRALISSRSPVLLYHDEVSRQFGVEDPVVLVVRTGGRDGVFDPAVLRLVRDLTGAVAAIEGIGRSRVQSLATERSDRFIPGTFSQRLFLDPLPESAESLDELRTDLAVFGIYTGTLVSTDGSSASILIEIPAGVPREVLLDRIRDVAIGIGSRSEAAASGTTVRLVGAPEAESLLGRHLMRDLGLPVHTSESDGAASASTGRSLRDLPSRLTRRVGLLPIAVTLMAFVFWVAFRRGLAVLLPLAAVAACLSVVLGSMGWLGVPVYLTTAVTPVILTMIGVADQIHIFWRYRSLRRARPSTPTATIIRETLREMAPPIAKTTLTTIVGFLSFVLSPLPPVRAFGAFTALGVAFCFAWSLFVVPALLQLAGPGAFGTRVDRSPAHTRRFDFFSALSKLVVHRSRFVLGLGLACVVAIPFGVGRLRVQDSWISGFSPSSPFRQATEEFDVQFNGGHVLLSVVSGSEIALSGELPAKAIGHSRIEFPLDLVNDPKTLIGCRITITSLDRDEPDDETTRLGKWSSWIVDADSVGSAVVVVTARRSGSPRMEFEPREDQRFRYRIGSRPFLWPETLARIAEFEAFLRSRRVESVGGVLGPAEFIATTNFLTSGRRADARVVPDDPDSILWLYERYGAVRGTERLREVVDKSYRRGIVTAFLKNANFADTRRLLEEIRAFERERLAPVGLRVEFAGDVAVSQSLVKGITDTQLRSLAFSLVGVFLITTIVNRSIRWGALSIVPVTLAVGAAFAMMGYTGMALGVSTSMFAGMALGDGVDFAIHFVSRYRSARVLGASSAAAIEDALRTTGPAITIGAAAIAVGFGVLTLSQVPVNARLGALVLATVLAAWAGTLLLLPVLTRLLDRNGGADLPIRRHTD